MSVSSLSTASLLAQRTTSKQGLLLTKSAHCFRTLQPHPPPHPVCLYQSCSLGSLKKVIRRHQLRGRDRPWRRRGSSWGMQLLLDHSQVTQRCVCVCVPTCTTHLSPVPPCPLKLFSGENTCVCARARVCVYRKYLKVTFYLRIMCFNLVPLCVNFRMGCFVSMATLNLKRVFGLEWN